MRPPTALSIAATDPSGADGLSADLKTFTALGVYGAAAVTALMLPDDDGDVRPRTLGADLVRGQVEAVLDEVEIDATRIGLLPTAAAAETVADLVETRADELGRIVLDVVMVNEEQTVLVTAEAAAALRTRLLPRAHVLVAGPLEAAQLLGEVVARDELALRDQAERLRALGPAAVVLRGELGDVEADDAEDADDEPETHVVIAHPGGADALQADGGIELGLRGTAATLSAAIAAQYARIAQFDREGELGEIGRRGATDDDLTVIGSAQEFLASAVDNAEEWEVFHGGAGPVNHLITLAE